MATRNFRPGDVIFRDPSSIRTANQTSTRADFFKCPVVNFFNYTDCESFEMLVINLSCLWPAFALRWTTEQDEAELEHALAAASTEAFLVREAIEIKVSAVAKVVSEVFNAAYFRKRGRELLRTLKSDEGSRARVDECLAFLRGLWGMLSPVSDSKEEGLLLSLPASVKCCLSTVGPSKSPGISIVRTRSSLFNLELG